MQALLLFLALVVGSASLVIAGTYFLFGVGVSMIVAGVYLFGGAVLMRRGMIVNG